MVYLLTCYLIFLINFVFRRSCLVFQRFLLPIVEGATRSLVLPRALTPPPIVVTKRPLSPVIQTVVSRQVLFKIQLDPEQISAIRPELSMLIRPASVWTIQLRTARWRLSTLTQDACRSRDRKTTDKHPRGRKSPRNSPRNKKPPSRKSRFSSPRVNADPVEVGVARYSPGACGKRSRAGRVTPKAARVTSFRRPKQDACVNSLLDRQKKLQKMIVRAKKKPGKMSAKRGNILFSQYTQYSCN